MQRRSNANGQELNSDNGDASEQKQSPPLNWPRPRPRRIRISTPAQEPETPPESEHPAPRACARAKPCVDKNINNFTKPAFFLTPRRAEKARIDLLYGMGRVPVSCLMILHMTFALGTGISSAREAFGTYARAELREVFSGYAWVMDVVKAPHFVIDFRAKCSRNCKANSKAR